MISGAKNIFAAHNVTFHEFAHQLYQADGHGDGIPTIKDNQAYQTCGRLLFDECEELYKKSGKTKTLCAQPLLRLKYRRILRRGHRVFPREAETYEKETSRTFR